MEKGDVLLGLHQGLQFSGKNRKSGIFGRFLLGPEIRSKMMFSERGVGGRVRLDFRLNIKIHQFI